MMKTFKTCLRKAGTIFFLTLISQTAFAASDAIETLAEYFQLLSTGNLESAANMWTESALERSSRFGIEYTGVPLKIDCASPIVCNFEKMRNFLQPPVKRVTELSGKDFVRLEYSAIVDGQLVEHFYYALFDGDFYWLTYPQDYYCRSWPVVESKYFRIHVHPDVRKYLNPAVLDEADRFVDRIADSLGVSETDFKAFPEKKIEYFFCNSDETIENITGTRIKGTFDLSSNDIISTFFPYYQEVARLLVNYKLRHLPISTHPLLREGLALYYGGRWGTAPAALMDLGGFLCREKVVAIDSLLTVKEFDDHAASDIAYPVAGLFTAYLLDKIGHSQYMDLYLALSGGIEAMQSLSDSAVQQALLKACNVSTWKALLDDFNQFIAKRSSAQAVMMPGGIDDGSSLVQKDGLEVAGDAEWLAFEFSTNSSQPPTGNLLFGLDERLSGGYTVMFDEQYQGKQPFDGYRFGVRFDHNEAGLYDYASNQVIAKYIWGMSPSDDYYDSKQNKITIKLKKDLVGDLLPSENDCKLIPL
jgi:hypothetical protein